MESMIRTESFVIKKVLNMLTNGHTWVILAARPKVSHGKVDDVLFHNTSPFTVNWKDENAKAAGVERVLTLFFILFEQLKANASIWKRTSINAGVATMNLGEGGGEGGGGGCNSSKDGGGGGGLGKAAATPNPAAKDAKGGNASGTTNTNNTTSKGTVKKKGLAVESGVAVDRPALSTLTEANLSQRLNQSKPKSFADAVKRASSIQPTVTQTFTSFEIFEDREM